MKRRAFAALLTAAATAALIGGTAPASASPPDRSALSYDENVTVNVACAEARKQGTGAYESCVRQQIAAREAHPAPDRAGLNGEENAIVERACGHARREGLAPYHDCLAKRIAAIGQRATAAFRPDEVLKHPLDEHEQRLRARPAAAVTASSLPLPKSVLPAQPERTRRGALPPTELYRELERSVFVVVAARNSADWRARIVAQGSAVAVSPHLLLTNCHVVHEREVIKLMQGTTVGTAGVVAADPKTDRCVIKTDDLTLTPVAGLRLFQDLAVGERVFTVGAPSSLERTLGEGLVSGLRQGANQQFVQTTAPISPGSSGGGLFDARGNLVGITTFQLVRGQNLNFAIAAEDYWR